MPEYYKTDKGYYYKKTKRGANRISVKEYNNAMKNKKKIKQKGGMYDEISKEELIKHIYEHLLKNNVIQRLKNEANDLVKTFTYLDAGAADERVSTIVYSSVSLGLSVTETFVYAGSAGSYRVSTITLS